MSYRSQIIERISKAIPRPKDVNDQDAVIEALCGVLATSYLASERMSDDLIQRCANHILKSLGDFADEIEAESTT